MHVQRLVRRDGPGRGRPDHDGAVFHRLQAEGLGQLGRFGKREGDVHGRVDAVGVFHFGFGQGRTTVETPVHGLQAAEHVTLVQDAAQRADFVGFIAEVHRHVRTVPAAQHAQALEVHALDVALFFGELSALLPEFNRVELGADLAPLLLDRDLDRQAVAVPARHVGCIEAGQVARLDDDVLQDLVDRMAEVDAAVGVRRAVVQHEQRAAGGVVAQLLVEPLRFPLRQNARLALGQVAAHREFGGWQVQGGLVVLAHAVARNLCSERMARACSASR
ncbi:hypothetical protein G6F22_016155 [Rhizopus arrhizus]|nr:hypothetical protein G6F22_016155 [Rhizopus arrhizus]